MKSNLLLSSLLIFSTTGIAGQEPMPALDQRVSTRTIYQKGDNGFDTYRIPATVLTTKGTILAFAEARKHSRSDTGDIDLVLRRSTDGGQTWGEIITVWDDADNVCGNPAPVVDQTTGRIILLSTWNNGSDHEKEIHARTSKDTRRVFVLYSDDDGRSWSQPREITSSVKRADWTWYATGPCHAIQLKKGKHNNRIVVSCNHGLFKNGESAGSYSHLIYSDDHGNSWAIGGEGERGGNESTVTELKNGDLMLNMRSTHRREKAPNGSCRLVAISHDQGLTLGPQHYDHALIEPVCNGSIINYAPKGKPTQTLLFSNPNHPTKRKDMTVKISKDGGKNWEIAYRVCDTPAAYSDMVVLPNGSVGILYETGEESCYERIELAILPANLFK